MQPSPIADRVVAMNAATPATLADALIPLPSLPSWLRHALLAGLGSLLLTLSAKTQIPFYPVPMTLQTCVVMLIGFAFGWRLGAATVLLYLAQGAAGLPVFAGTPEKGLGLAYMAGPTGGYLFGFVLAALITGKTIHLTRHWLGLALGTGLATLAIFVPGYLWLATLIGIEPAWVHGVAPFMLGALVKGALAVAVTLAGAEWVTRRLQRTHNH
ncbi:MAG: biotin transporter BioY [Geminicoccaceae bacterium]